MGNFSAGIKSTFEHRIKTGTKSKINGGQKGFRPFSLLQFGGKRKKLWQWFPLSQKRTVV
jgi:hypothetical protein